MSARKSSQHNLQERTGGNILVLCYGNIYRSPFVERRLSQLLHPDEFSIRSAGFFDRTGRPCTSEYISLASEAGVSLLGHYSQKVSTADIEWADIIVIMDRKNWDALRYMGVTVGRKVVWIGCCLGNGLPEVKDPYGMRESEVRRTLLRLNESAENIANALCNLS